MEPLGDEQKSQVSPSSQLSWGYKAPIYHQTSIEQVTSHVVVWGLSSYLCDVTVAKAFIAL